METIYCIFRQTKGHTFKTEKVVKSDIELSPPFMLSNLVHKFQIICEKWSLSNWAEIKCGCMDMGKTKST